MRKLIVAMLMLMCAVAPSGFSEDAALAAASFPGLGAFSHILVDPGSQHVFITGGSGTNGVNVFNLQGTFLETLPDLPGASGMTMSADGQNLYVALADGDGIGQIDVYSLAAVTLKTGAGTCPQSVAVAKGLVWFGYICKSGDLSGVGALDPATGDVTVDVIDVPADTASVFASPSVPGALFVTELNGDNVTKYAIVGGAKPSAKVALNVRLESNDSKLAFTPDGRDIVVASAYPYYHQVLRTKDFSNDGSYASAPYPGAVAINAQGLVIAGSFESDPAIWAYAPNAPAAEATWGFDASTQTFLARDGLAVNGNTIYAVSQQGFALANYQLHVLKAPAEADLTLISDQSRYRYGSQVHLTAHLNSTDENQTVTIYAKPLGSRLRTLTTGQVNLHGYLTTTYRVTRRTNFLVQYDGGPLQGWAQAKAPVTVDAHLAESPTGQYSSRHGQALVHVDHKAGLRVHVSPAHPGECIGVQGQRLRDRRWHSILNRRCVALDRNSEVHTVLPGPHQAGDLLRIRALWPGDRASSSATGAWQKFRFTR